MGRTWSDLTNNYMSELWIAAAAAVVSTGISAYSANQQSKAAGATSKALGGLDAADKLHDALQANPQDLYGTKFIPEEYKSKVGTKDSYAEGMFEGKLDVNSLPELFTLTDKINKQNLGNANDLTGGKFGKVINRGGRDILQMLKGKVPADVVDSINRLVAENLGGAVSPSSLSGGFDMSATAADTARRLGLTSFDIMQKGVALAPAWQQTVQSFLYRPEQAARDFLFPEVNAELQGEALQKSIDENEYYSTNNKLRADASPDPQARGKVNDALTLLALQTGASYNYQAAQAGLINAYAGVGSSVASLGKTVAGYGASQNTGQGIASGTPYATPSAAGPQTGTYYV